MNGEAVSKFLKLTPAFGVDGPSMLINPSAVNCVRSAGKGDEPCVTTVLMMRDGARCLVSETVEDIWAMLSHGED